MLKKKHVHAYFGYLKTCNMEGLWFILKLGKYLFENYDICYQNLEITSESSACCCPPILSFIGEISTVQSSYFRSLLIFSDTSGCFWYLRHKYVMRQH